MNSSFRVHIQDTHNFLSHHKLELPDSLAKMTGFIDSFSEPGLRNLFRSPKKFIKEYVTIYGETEAGEDKTHALVEKFSELYMLANSGSHRKIAESFREIFNENAFAEDWSSKIDDRKLLEIWNRLFRPDRLRSPAGLSTEG